MSSRSAKTNANSSSSSRIGYAPVAMSRAVVSQRIPQIMSTGNTTRISHSEFFTSVVSASTDYAVSCYPCNPGVASMFPWLSQVALRYETYKFRRLSFEYHTRAATSQVGTVGMVFDFDAEDSAPSSQMMALSYHDKCADSPWKDSCVTLDLTQGDRLPIRYTRAGIPSGDIDIKTYDVGNLYLFVDGVAASTNLGLVEVKYVIDLYTPQIQNPVGGKFSASTALDATHLIGGDFTADPEAIAVFDEPTSTNVLKFNQTWEGLISFQIVGTGLSANLAPGVASGTAAIVGQTVNAAGTLVWGLMKVRATTSTTLTPTITATTVTGAVYFFSTVAYVSVSA